MDRPKDYCRDCYAGWLALGERAATDNRPLPVLPAQRPAPNPGPRCATHWRAERKRRAVVAHDKRVQGVYGLPPGAYDLLYAGQGGTCSICQRARGVAKRLAVDHNHATGEVRGLLCGPCNSMLAHARDSDMMLIRAAQYLLHPPARTILGGLTDGTA